MQKITYNKAEESTSVINDEVTTVTTVRATQSTSHFPGPSRTTVKGLNVVTTCVFIVGVVAGAGFLALPQAVDNTGWIGLLLMFACSGSSAFTGNLLGKCWIIVREEHPELKEMKIGDPYPRIGEAAFGKAGRYLVSVSMFCTLFGGTVVYVLIAAENIRELLPADHTMNICYLTLIIGGVMTPFTWLGTPKDFWGIAAIACSVTAGASIILFIDVLVTTEFHDVLHSDVSIVSFFTGYGTLVAAFNGHSAFPTFQSDMKEPAKFGRSIILSYIIILLIYVPTAAAGYVLFGKGIQPNVILNMPTGPPKTIVSVLITAHLLFALLIVLNPVSQAVEQLLKIPKHFTWKRIISRTCVMASVLFVAESVPHFSSILSLVGGSTVSMLSIICPPLFYMKLVTSTTKPHMRKEIPLHMNVLYSQIMLIGLVAGVAATYSAITDLATNKFTVPCYVDPDRATK